MQLSDIDIKNALKAGDILIENFDETRLQPASYDVLLGFDFMIFDSHKLTCIDPKQPVQDYIQKISLKSEEDWFVLHPGEFALGVTWDFFGANGKYAIQVMGKSSLARLGLIVHTTAGFVDPGNYINLTLEFVNTNTVPIKLYPMMKIAQIAFFELKTPAEKLYGDQSLNSKYYKSKTVEASKMWQNFSE